MGDSCISLPLSKDMSHCIIIRYNGSFCRFNYNIFSSSSLIARIKSRLFSTVGFSIACDQCKVFGHLAAFNCRKSCFLQFVRKIRKLLIAVQFATFTKCSCPCKDGCYGVRRGLFTLPDDDSNVSEQFRVQLRIRNSPAGKPVRKSSLQVNQMRKKPYRS